MGSCLRLRAFAYLPNDRFEEDLILNGRDLIKHTKMDAIKKKMQAMKLEKDNAMDRADACEQQAKDANLRAERAEEEVRELQKKMQQLENDLDQTQEKLMNANQTLKEKSPHSTGESSCWRRTWRGARSVWPPLHRNLPRQAMPPTSPSGYERHLRIRTIWRMTEWRFWRLS